MEKNLAAFNTGIFILTLALMFMKFLFMSNQGIVSMQDFQADITRIGKISSKMFGFQMVPHIRSRMIKKIVTKSATKFPGRIFSEDNILV